MTYDTERTPRIPAESPEGAERSPVTPDRAANSGTGNGTGNDTRSGAQAPVTPDRSKDSEVSPGRRSSGTADSATRTGATQTSRTDEAERLDPAERPDAAQKSRKSALDTGTAVDPTTSGSTAPDRKPSLTPGDTPRKATAGAKQLFPEGDQGKLSQRLQHAVTEFVESPFERSRRPEAPSTQPSRVSRALSRSDAVN
ncbi:hypothetical protein [Streptomyces sp. RKAG290]|uniref:hypothetical protein n=1 Tax=Streptomyces sp. RKAG290 TaxID=2888348 RepID=UPI002033357F|nr:hypothetical protein [Streptomyces sp. RKAG290]MCM2415839.1 hypothetical protein [Streptomyces sp. RKAG290]